MPTGFMSKGINMKKTISLVVIVSILITSTLWLVSCDKIGVATPKIFIVGEEILFENGKEFTVYHQFNGGLVYDPIKDAYIMKTVLKPCTITSAKLVAVEKIPLDDPSKWGSDYGYYYSYKYCMYVTGYAPELEVGTEFNLTLQFRTDPYDGNVYRPSKNYESTVVGEDGYFEFSVDVYTPDIVTKVHPVNLEYRLNDINN